MASPWKLVPDAPFRISMKRYELCGVRYGPAGLTLALASNCCADLGFWGCFVRSRKRFGAGEARQALGAVGSSGAVDACGIDSVAMLALGLVRQNSLHFVPLRQLPQVRYGRLPVLRQAS